MTGAGKRPWWGPCEVLALVELAVLSLAALAHRLQLVDVNAYRHSPLIAVEVLGLLGALLLAPIFLVRVIYFLFGRRWQTAAVNCGIGLLAIAVALWAMWIDAPTLLHMT